MSAIATTFQGKFTRAYDESRGVPYQEYSAQIQEIKGEFADALRDAYMPKNTPHILADASFALAWDRGIVQGMHAVEEEYSDTASTLEAAGIF